LDFLDTAGNEWGISSPQTGAGSEVSIDSGGMLKAISAFVYPVILLSDTDGLGCGELIFPGIKFQIDGTDPTKTDVSFGCVIDGTIPSPFNTGHVETITQVPEPATLALLGAALGVAGFATRHRKLS
jgi:hypothetical protein